MTIALAFTVDNHEQADGVERLIGWPTVNLREFVSLTRMRSAFADLEGLPRQNQRCIGPGGLSSSAGIARPTQCAIR